MTALSAETRRLLDLSRDSDDPTPARELAVRDRLIARLGVTALLGVAGASAAVGAAEAASAAGGAAAAKAVSAGATAATWAKTVATLAIVASLGAGVRMSDGMSDDNAPPVVAWSVAVAGEVKHAVKRAWQIVTNSTDDDASADAPRAIVPPVSAEGLHQRLIAIARRPNHPVAKEAELVLIMGAERALAEGDADLAKRYLDRHEARFAGGELRADREALRILCDRAHQGTNF